MWVIRLYLERIVNPYKDRKLRSDNWHVLEIERLCSAKKSWSILWAFSESQYPPMCTSPVGEHQIPLRANLEHEYWLGLVFELSIMRDIIDTMGWFGKNFTIKSWTSHQLILKIWFRQKYILKSIINLTETSPIHNNIYGNVLQWVSWTGDLLSETSKIDGYIGTNLGQNL